MEEQLDKLGFEAKDKITGISGVLTSLSFDVYGCVQFCITPKSKDGSEYPNTHWFDANRIEITNKKRSFDKPDFNIYQIISGNKGCCNHKPTV